MCSRPIPAVMPTPSTGVRCCHTAVPLVVPGYRRVAPHQQYPDCHECRPHLSTGFGGATGAGNERRYERQLPRQKRARVQEDALAAHPCK